MVSSSPRFRFGANWNEFLTTLNDKRIEAAEESLKRQLEVEELIGKRFLDIGSGSGLFSLAARRLGASVHSFDYDPESVACTMELRRRYFTQDQNWTIEQGDVLDGGYMESLGEFDIVYSWGVLHHTGAMWKALEQAAIPLSSEGSLYIAIYNDQGGTSMRWTTVKKLYNWLWNPFKIFLVLCIGLMFELRHSLAKLMRLQNPLPFKDWAAKKRDRGMSVWHDLVDWVGGYPFEVAKPEEIFRFYRNNGFVLTQLKTCGGGLGCNEFVFRKVGRFTSSKT